LRSEIAGYRLTDPIDDSVPSTSWYAEPPSRIGVPGPVVVAELDVDEDSWPAAAGALARVAAVRSPYLASLLEAGRTEERGGAVAWCSRSRNSSRPAGTAGLAPSDLLRALAGAARGAHALHEAGMVHGGIRPGSVLATGNGGLLDSPIEQQCLDASAALRVRSPVDVDGVDAAALWGHEPSRSTDVYALAAAAHVLLTGKLVHPALAGDQPVTAVQRVLVERPFLDPQLDGPLARLIGACLAPDPARRPETASALAERLDQLAA
jgi:serine/threonine protein kinase